MDEILVLNGEEFLICREFNVDNKHYIYAVSIESNKYTLLTGKNENGELVVESVTDADEIKKILGIIAKENI